MLVKLETYHKYVNYWNEQSDEVKLQMIASIQKAATWANRGYSEPVKLYALYMKDGEKNYTNYAGFRKILKIARQNGVDLDVR